MKKTGKGGVRWTYYDIINKICQNTLQSLSWGILQDIVSEIIIIGQRKSVSPSVLVSSLEENDGSFVGDRHPYRIGSSLAVHLPILHLCLLLNHLGY